MSNRLELPDELNSLIEKRESEDRREAERRAAESPVASDEERRTSSDRRQADRRSDEAVDD